MNKINKIAVGSNTYEIIDTWRPVSDSVSSTESDTAASSAAVKTAYDLAASKTSNTGTVTSVAIKMNGSTKGTVTTSGTIDLGTVITAHQNISGKVNTSTKVNGHALTGDVTVSKTDVGLGNVTNDAQVKRTEMGAASGVATLGTDGKVPSSQLPSYVDDVLEYTNLSSFPSTGESGKIYVAQDTNKTYRWSGSAYTEISSSIVVGTTTGTAFDGKSGYDHVNNTSNPHGVTKAQVGLGKVGNFKAVSTVDSQGLTDKEKSNARANIGAGTSSFSGSYNDLTNKPTIPTVNNATLTIQKNGTTVNTFTANASSNVTANITVPTNVSELTNDAGYTTNTGTVTSVKVGSTSYSPSSGVISLPAYPTSLPASDVYSWAKASTKPTYIANEVMSISAMNISSNTSSSCSITGYDNNGKAQTIVYYNASNSDVIVTVPTDYFTPDDEAIELTCKAGGYCEVSYLNVVGNILARGL